jgi:hypothetical protein
MGARTTALDITFINSSNNVGILLRRTLDHALADQRAKIFVADPDSNNSSFADVGTWYLAGSVRTLYANPPSETGVVVPSVFRGERRFRDDEFLIARKFTQGRRRLRIRVQVLPVTRPLVLNGPPESAGWSEFKYEVFAWKLPTPERLR